MISSRRRFCDARRELLARERRDLHAPVVERRREAHADGELAGAKRRAEDDAALFVDDVDAARGAAAGGVAPDVGLGVEHRQRLAHDAPDVVPRDDDVALALVDALPVAEKIALLRVLAMEVAELVGGLRPCSCRRACARRAGGGSPPLRRRAARARGEGEHACALVEDEDGADARRLALRGRQPALGELVEARRIGDGDDDVVLLDDLLVDPVRLLGGERERRFEDRLLAELVDLERRAKRE